MDEAPSLRSITLHPMLSNSIDSFLPATLGIVRKSDHYALAVQNVTQDVPPELSNTASKAVPGAPLLRPHAPNLLR